MVKMMIDCRDKVNMILPIRGFCLAMRYNPFVASPLVLSNVSLRRRRKRQCLSGGWFVAVGHIFCHGSGATVQLAVVEDASWTN
jgi:hypothetical protein